MNTAGAGREGSWEAEVGVKVMLGRAGEGSLEMEEAGCMLGR